MSSDTPTTHKPRTVRPTSDAGGPVYEYRGAVIYSNEKGTIFSFKLEGFPHGPVTSVNVVEKANGLEVATAQAALGGSCKVSLVGDGLSISPMASTPM